MQDDFYSIIADTYKIIGNDYSEQELFLTSEKRTFPKVLKPPNEKELSTWARVG